jgi:shikimate dehydrogenase
MDAIADGNTRLLAIVGDPVRQVRAPRVWSALFRAYGHNILCLPFHVAPVDLGGFVAGLRGVRNLAGLIVTVPHKPAAAGLADRLTPRAARIGAVNVMRRDADGGWTGDMLDGEGFVLGLRASGQDVAGRRALVVGAGGVGTAIAVALADAGVASVHVADLDPARAEALAAHLASLGIASGVAPAAAAGFGVVVNATPLGLKPDDPLPFDCDGLAPGTIVGDVVMGAQPAPLLAVARARGCHAQAGTEVMDRQLPAMADFLGLPPGDYGPDAVKRIAFG